MITAHLPAGYLLATAGNIRGFVAFGARLLGSIFPDFDLIWFYLIDNRQFHHHLYWVHIPGFWLPLAAALYGAAYLAGQRVPAPVGWFLCGIALHIALDSVVGGVAWLWPVNNTIYTMMTVPASQPHWLLSFVLHWTFMLELLVWAAFGVLWFSKRRRTRGMRPGSPAGKKSGHLR